MTIPRGPGIYLRMFDWRKWKSLIMLRLLELKKANNGINLVREVMKNLMRTRLLPLPLMRKSMRKRYISYFHRISQSKAGLTIRSAD